VKALRTARKSIFFAVAVIKKNRFDENIFLLFKRERKS